MYDDLFAYFFFHRPLTMGEIGCFLSHYLIWQEVQDILQHFLKVLIPTFDINLIQFLGSFVISQMINNGLSQVLILEDDVRFEPNFRNQLRGLLVEATTLSSRYRWELM